jgi:protocatechuate 3,4-dioxygenase beta subunit
VPAGLGRSDAPAAAVAAALPSEREAPAAAAADGGAKAEPAADTASARVPAWLARFLVVGEDDRPVADAVVTVWSPKRVKHEVKHDAAMQKAMGIEGNAYSGHGPTPLLELHTDVQGHAQATFELECVTVSASKGDLTTGEYMLGHTRAAKQEMKLVLETPLVVRGIVLHSDGRPAAGARVVAYVNGGSILQRGRAQMPKPIATGSDGRFELPVRAHVGYGVRGELGGAKTFSERVRIHPPQQVDELVLCFPGGITLEGIVVDASGKPVAKAEVTAWREYHPEQRNPLDSERGDAKSGDDGRFSIPVRRHARYQLVASEGVYANSTATWIETSPAQPHADVRLVLLQFAAIQGRVVHGDGAPFPGVRVSALPGIVETSHGIGMPTLRDRFGAVKDVTTGDDGGFALLVHPTVTWTVRALPVPEHRALVFEQRGIAAGRDDVELRIGDRELAGCTVHGTVTRSGGQPVGPFDVQVYAWEDDKSEHFDAVDARARIDGDAFTLSALPLGRRFALVVRPRSGDGPGDRNELLAPAQTGPFLTDRAELEVDVRVEEWAWLSVKVLNDQGLPARSVRLSARREPQVGPPIAGGQVDADGGNTLWCAPGLHRLQVWTLRDKLTDQEVVVTSGINPDIVVRLPAGR